MRTMESEFPDYDDVELSIPPFVCQPWHNDACPKYVWEGEPGTDLEDCRLTLWVDYKDPEKREVRNLPRYHFVVEDTRDNTIPCEFTGSTVGGLRADVESVSGQGGAVLEGRLARRVVRRQ